MPTASAARSGAARPAASVAVPIFEPIMQAVWANYAPKTALAPPSAEARRDLVDRAIDLNSGDFGEGGGRGNFIEYFRRGADTQYRLVSRGEAYTSSDPRDPDVGAYQQQFPFGNRGQQAPQPQYRDIFGRPVNDPYRQQGQYPNDPYRNGPYANAPRPQPAQPWNGGLFGQPQPAPQQPAQQQQRGYPAPFWNSQRDW